MKLNIRPDFARAQRYLQAVPQALRDKAAARAMNRAIETGRTRMTRAIAAEFKVPSATVRERLTLRRASGARSSLKLEAVLAAKGKRSFNVLRFLERSVTLAAARRRRKAGTLDRLFVQIKRGGGKKALPPGAFVQTARGGTAVFRRVGGKGSRRIEAVNTIAVPQMFNTGRVKSLVVRAIREVFARRFQHEAAQVLRSGR
jgi:hypothetical protein